MPHSICPPDRHRKGGKRNREKIGRKKKGGGKTDKKKRKKKEEEKNTPRSHISYSLLLNRPISHRLRQIIPPESPLRHDHVEARIRALQRVLCIPVQHDEALKGELPLQHPVEEFAVLARVRVVDAVVGAHDGGGARADAVHKGPEVVLMEGLVVHVGGGGLDAKVGTAVGFLFVGDEVLDVVRGCVCFFLSFFFVNFFCVFIY